MNRAKGDVVLLRLMPVDGPVQNRGVARSLKFMAAHFQTPVQLQDLVVESGMSRRDKYTIAAKLEKTTAETCKTIDILV